MYDAPLYVKEWLCDRRRTGGVTEDDMLIELATLADAQEILDLQTLAYQSEAAIYGDYSLPPLTQTLDQLRGDFERQVVFKAVEGDRIVGSVRGCLREGTCHIARLMVHPEWQNRGIGTRLMEAIERHFAAARRYGLFTGERSERNLHLYRKLGYRVLRTERQTEKVNVVFMEKPSSGT